MRAKPWLKLRLQVRRATLAGMGRRHVVIVLAGLALGVGAAVAGVAMRDDDSASAPLPFRGNAPPRPLLMPDFRLRNYSGELVASHKFRGKVVLLTFLETRCREACPAIAAQIGRAVRGLSREERRQVVALAISTHPKDDTPASVRAFLRARRAEDLVYLLGSEAELRPVWKSFYVLSALDSGDADTHSAPVRIFNREGEWVATQHEGIDLSVENLVHDVRVALSSS
jgi:cytochrome oxidase Cu insertion factor (SCO1/SenC/PrrC family)